MEMVFLPKTLKINLRKRMYRKIKLNSWIALISAMIGMLFAMLASEEYFIENPSEGKGRNEENSAWTSLRFFVSLTTIVLLFCIVNHYKLNLGYNKAKEWVDHTTTLWSSGQVKWLISEMIICSIHSPPFVNFTWTEEQQTEELTYSLDTIFTMIILIRCYWLLRVFTVYSYWNSEDTEKVLNEWRIFGGRTFAIKWELKERPYMILLVSILTSMFIFGFALRSAEIPYMAVSGQDWTYLWHSIWCIIITMTTVGYGDFYPLTYVGRGIGVWACFLGTFLISLMIVSLTISVQFTINQQSAYKEAVQYCEKVNNK